ncbi:uncharacterized protein LOC127102877 [Lathyrus oleraceus]|uniref:uncharacterized protein LOC127102877 n=1 Tax=Pisum sativum TaxID=3888 RepID=UPI0021D3D400|nr:uncharacterized protein LOC127102877 [Pisum sativum]
MQDKTKKAVKTPTKKATSTNKDAFEEKDEGDTNKITITKAGRKPPPTPKKQKQKETQVQMIESDDGVADGTTQPTIKQAIPVSSNDPSYHPTSTPNHHPTSPKDSTKEFIDEVDKPIKETQKDHTIDSEHEDEKEKNAPVKGEVDVEMQNVDEVVEDISEDGYPTIENPDIDGPDDEEEEDHFMSNFHMEPAKDEDEEQDNEQENKQTNDMSKTNPTSNAAKDTISPSTRTNVALSPEELEALKQSKPMEYLKATNSAGGSSTEKSHSTSIVSGGQSTSKYGHELLLKIKEKSFHIDLLQVLENDTSACFGIKDLFKQVNVLNASIEVADVIMDLGFLINQVVAELNRIREASNKI